MRLILHPVFARAAFFAAAIAILILANLPDPPQLPGQLSDKVQHMLAFVVLAGLARIAWPKVAWWAILISLAAFGALIEMLQAAAELGRDPSMADWLADVAAIALALIAISATGRLARMARRFFATSGSAK